MRSSLWRWVPRSCVAVPGTSDDGTKLHTKWLSTTAYGIRGDYGAAITKVGIDAPFGWPEPFLDALVAYRHSPAWPTGLDNPLDECRWRETDRAVHRRSAKWPLSVSADKIAAPAMRCATLLTHIAEQVGETRSRETAAGSAARSIRTRRCAAGPRMRRSASPPAKATRVRRPRRSGWTCWPRSSARLAFRDPDRRLQKVAIEDDYLDALICALVARAVDLGRTHGPEGEEETRRAPVEGWIHLPSGPADELAA